MCIICIVHLHLTARNFVKEKMSYSINRFSFYVYDKLFNDIKFFNGIK